LRRFSRRSSSSISRKMSLTHAPNQFDYRAATISARPERRKPRYRRVRGGGNRSQALAQKAGRAGP
jgi:hypothetical protein